MPNWCENDLTITGSAEDIEKVLTFIQSPTNGDKDESVFDFDKVIPYPDKYKELDVKAAEYIREIAEAKSDEQRAQIRQKYGVEEGQFFFKDGFNSGGYEWCCDSWGTKWNAVNAQVLEQTESIVKLTFDTAWSPPIPVIEKLGEQFPSVNFVLEFFEGGMGFQGCLDIENGISNGAVFEDYNGERGG